MIQHFRVARPVSNLERSAEMYCLGLNWMRLGGFEQHEGFSGVMVGDPEGSYHLELVTCEHHPISPSPTVEDLLVFYVPDRNDWEECCERMILVGFIEIEPFNPYWKRGGRTFQDHDGYGLVLYNSEWKLT
ncbi:MAG: VOC family protein [Armatimonadetes bacterium]|nr:VOC family protein [Armatimonadota bacterium]